MTESMVDMNHYVVFTLDERFYGVRLSVVARVLRAVEITPLPKAPPIVIGVINLGGRIIPVVNIRRRFQPPRARIGALPTSSLWHAPSGVTRMRTEGRLLALAVDAVVGVRDLSTKVTIAAETILPGLEHLEGVAKTEQGLVLIHDLGTFLSLEEESALGALLPEGKE